MIKVARYILLSFLASFVTLAADAQLCFPVKKVYAYFQPVTAGIMSKDEAKDRRERGNYLVYFTSKKPGVSLSNVWINGALHHAELKEVTEPVSISGSNILLPAKGGKTYQLLFTSLDATGTKSVVPAKFANRPLVMELKYKKKTKYLALDKIEQLNIQPLQ